MIRNNSLDDSLIEDSVLTIGQVQSVKGQGIVVKVYKDKNLPHLFFRGKTVKNVSVGLSNYVKILKGFTTIICKVEGEYLEENKGLSPKAYSSEKQRFNRYLTVSVFGFYDHQHRFQHGIKEMPLIGSDCKLLTNKEFELLHCLAKENELSIPVGSLVDEETQQINLSVSKLFAGHIGVFGNTGSGKFNTLAKIYTELFRQNGMKQSFQTISRFIFIDFNGEYSGVGVNQILTDAKDVYRLNTRTNNGDKYPIPRGYIEKLETLSILLDATEKTQRPFLHRAISSDWLSINNLGHTKQIASINEKQRTIFSKKDRSFGIPFLKKSLMTIKDLGTRF